ncbi:MAG: CBS domain-containing protein [Cyanobacteria bacterium J06648_11]
MPATVADVMTRDPIAVKPDTSLQDALQILAEKQIGGLPVLDDTGVVVGLLSEDDLMVRESGVTPPPFVKFLDLVVYLQNPMQHERELHKALGQTVGEVMSDRPLTVSADLALPEAAQILHDKRLNRLLVTDGDRLAGVITRGDIVRAMAAGRG